MSAPTWNVTITWPAATQAVQYQVQRSPDGTTWGTLATVTTLSYLDRNVPTGVLNYRIIAQNSVGTATTLNGVLTLPATTGPPTLTNVEIPSSVSLAWTPSPSTNGIGYGPDAAQIVQRSIDNGVTWIAVSGSLLPSVSTFTDKTTTTASVVIAWGAATWGIQYLVQRSLDEITWTTLSTVTALTYTDASPPLNTFVSYRVTPQNSVGSGTPIQAGIYTASPQTQLHCWDYFYRILARNSDGDTPGQSQTITTLPPIEQMDASSTEKPLAITLTWRPLPNLSPLPGQAYQVERADPPGYTFTVTVGSNLVKEICVDTTVSPGVLYVYRVVGYSNAPLPGFYTSPILAVYAPGPVAPLAPTVQFDPLLPFVNLFWLPSLAAITYGVERSIDGGSTWVPQVSGLFGGFWIDSAPPWGLAQTVEYRIRASDSFYSNASLATSLVLTVPPPSVPTLTNQNGSVLVSFGGLGDAHLQYHVQRSADNLTWSDLTILASPGVSGAHTYTYTDSAVTQWHRYYYRAVAEALFPFRPAGTQFGLSRSIVYAVPGAAPGFRVIVNGSDLSTIVERGNALQVTDQVAQAGAQARFRLVYDGAASPPQIVTR